MSRIVVLSDLHIGKNEEYDQDVFQGCREAGNYAANHNIMKVVIAGDIFDRSRPTPKMNAHFGRCLDRLQSEEIFVISGNHDVSSQYSTVEAFQSRVFNSNSNLYFINEEKNFLWEGITMLFYPFVLSKDFGLEVSRSINAQESSIDLMITHTDIPGAVYGAEREVQLGDVGTLTAIKKNKVKLIISGHIHRHQHGIFGGIPYVYPGSLARISHAEEKEDKGFIVVDTETLKWEFIKRKTARKWATVDWSWSGKAPIVKSKADVLRVNLKADQKYRGSIDRVRIEKKLLETYSQVKLNIEYDRKINKKAQKAAKGLSFEEYEAKWIDLNAKGHKADVKKRIHKVLSQVEDTRKTSKVYSGLILDNIELTNFQSIKSAMKSFKPTDCVGILGMIDGQYTQSNGSGKSSFVEGVRWVLYNTTRYSKNVSAIRDGQEFAYGMIKLRNAKGELISIEREQKENASASTCSVTDSKGNMLAKGKEVAKWVEENGGLSDKAFESIVYIGGKDRHGIIGAKPMERLRTLQEPLPFERYTKYALDIVKGHRSANKSIMEQLRGVVDEYTGLLEDDEDIEGKKAERKELERMIASHHVELEKMSSRMDRLEKDSKKAWEWDQLNRELREIVEEIAESQVELDKLKKKENPDKEKVEKDIKNTQKELDKNAPLLSKLKVKGEVQRNIIDTTEEELSELRKMEGKMEDNCPTCGQVWNEEVKEVHRKKLQDKSKQAQLLRIEIAKDYKECSNVIRDCNNRRGQSDIILSLIIKHESDLEDGMIDINEMKADMKKIQVKKVKLKLTKSYKVINTERERLKKDRDSKSEIMSEWKDDLNEVSNEISLHTQNVARLKVAQVKLKKAEKENSILNICYDAFSAKGIPQFIVMSIIDEINFVIPKVINDFAFWQDIDITLEPDVSKANSTIAIWAKISDKQKREYEGLSCGEREIVNFIFTMAYREVLTNLININYNFILVDEALDVLDEANLKAAIQYFRKAKLQSFCISHSDLKDVFNKTVIINNENGVAEVL